VALTPIILFGGMCVLAVPFLVHLLNRRKRNTGWIFIAVLVALLIGGNLAERIATGSSPLF
jgi:hypothetical protein